ncbi:hypothetical protein AB0H30_23530 [Streptomyces pseudogriseolus]|uniref:hypothetical protein n=1 Tax=Streptomyces pseudogriseolus TaxID=36817 RepID=UPI00346B355A
MIGVHTGFVDTDLSAWTDAPKISPELVAALTTDALKHGRLEVLADEQTRAAKAALSTPTDKRSDR